MALIVMSHAYSPHVHVPIRGEAMTVVVDGEGPGKHGGEDARRVGTL